MGTLGGSLKRREKISGRLADALGWMYLASAIIKRYHDEPQTEESLNLARWGLVHALNLIERTAICIVLPPCKRCHAEDWTLALAADNRTLRATNAAGRRAVIKL